MISKKIERENSEYYINFKNVKEDFEFINKKIKASYENGERFTLTDIKNNNSITQKKIENIKKYMKENLCSTDEFNCYIKSNLIVYSCNINRTTFVVYSPDKKSVKNKFKMPIYKLDENWYYIHEHHL